MAYLNQIEIIGRLGHDAELFQGLRPRLRMSVCTSKRIKRKDGGDPIDVSDWHNVTAWGKLAEIVGRFGIKKGAQVYVKGELHIKKWTDDQNVTRSGAEIDASDIQVLENRKAQEEAGPGERNPEPADTGDGSDFDNLPF